MTASLDPIQSHEPNRQWPSIAWFKLIDNLAEFDKASAYPCKWNKDDSKWESWQKFEADVYSTIEHITGTTDDFLPCWHNGRVWEVISTGSQQLYRGVTTSAITKGGVPGAANVTRYEPGTNTESSTHDTVYSDLANVASGKKVVYFKNGSKLYILAVERVEQEIVLDMRIKADNSQIEASTVTAQLETAAASAWEDKIALDDCT